MGTVLGERFGVWKRGRWKETDHNIETQGNLLTNDALIIEMQRKFLETGVMVEGNVINFRFTSWKIFLFNWHSSFNSYTMCKDFYFGFFFYLFQFRSSVVYTFQHVWLRIKSFYLKIPEKKFLCFRLVSWLRWNWLNYLM